MFGACREVLNKFKNAFLKEEAKIFEKAEEIRKIIEERTKKMFRDPKVYIIGSFKEKKHKLSSDLDILIVSKDIPKKNQIQMVF